jgi:hypothetical protein
MDCMVTIHIIYLFLWRALHRSFENMEELHKYSRPPLPPNALSNRFSEHSGRFRSLYDIILEDENTLSRADEGHKDDEHTSRADEGHKDDEHTSRADEGHEDDERHDSSSNSSISKRMMALHQQLSHLSHHSRLYEYASLPFTVRGVTVLHCTVL